MNYILENELEGWKKNAYGRYMMGLEDKYVMDEFRLYIWTLLWFVNLIW